MTTTTIDDLNVLASRVGEEIAVSEWFPVDQQRIDLFARATDDFQWIHVDRERAAESPYGGTIAHGFLTVSLIAPLFEQALTFANSDLGVNYGLNRVRFTAPVPAGSAVRGRFTLKDYRALDNGAQLTWDVIIECEGSTKPACIVEWITRRF